jgi:transcriptional regulator with XRE-family HTH domain
MHWGHAVRRLRLEQGLSQEELAHRCGTTAANISRIETGKHGASATLARLLAQQFGLKVYQLAAMAEGASLPDAPAARYTGLSREEEGLLQHFRGLRRQHRRLIAQLCASLSEATGPSEVSRR